MRKSVGAAVLVMTLLLASAAASAQAAVYEGVFKGLPGSSVELTFTKDDGKRFLTEYFLSYRINCENGQVYQSTQQDAHARVRDGKFKILTGSPDSDAFFRLAGDLTRKRAGKAVGTFRYKAVLVSPFGACDTGLLDWVAFKQPPP